MITRNQLAVVSLSALLLVVSGPTRADAAAHGGDAHTPPKLKRCTIHPYIRYVGRVTISATADVDGRLRNPVIVSSTNNRLNRMFQDSVRTYWLCTPASVNGKPVPSVLTSTIRVRYRQPVEVRQES